MEAGSLFFFFFLFKRSFYRISGVDADGGSEVGALRTNRTQTSRCFHFTDSSKPPQRCEQPCLAVP